MEDDLDWLGGLPLQQRVSLGASFHPVHAAPTGPLRKRLHLLMAPEATLEAELAGIEADVLFVGHTHMPGLRKVGETIIVHRQSGEPGPAAPWHPAGYLRGLAGWRVGHPSSAL